MDELFKMSQLLGARNRATGAYVVVREDCAVAGNDADGAFSTIPY